MRSRRAEKALGREGREGREGSRMSQQFARGSARARREGYDNPESSSCSQSLTLIGITRNYVTVRLMHNVLLKALLQGKTDF